MKHGNSKDVLKWLKSAPTFKELCTEFPAEWTAVQKVISDAADKGNSQDLGKIVNQKIQSSKSQTKKAQISISKRNSPKNSKNFDPELSQYIRGQMLKMAIKNYGLSEATGVKQGKIKLNFLNGYTIQKLLFSVDLVRKPVSLFWFRLLWPLVWQRNYLMPLVEPEGIYCFYSRKLIEAMSGMIGERSCLEIAAGDGTLARFLKDQGVKITASDSGSWKNASPSRRSGGQITENQNTETGEVVLTLDAKKSLQKYSPEVVVCSWPPANNDFEKEVFKTRSVQLYIVIASRLKSASGNWSDYKQQSSFSFEEDKVLSKMLLPPELGCAVYIFRRKS